MPENLESPFSFVLWAFFIAHALQISAFSSVNTKPGEGGGVLPSKRLLGMCRWMGLHFNNWTDYNGVTFLVELLEWGRTFSGCLG